MTWFQAIPALFASACILFIPGAILARAAGARGMAWLATAAPLSVSLVGVGALASHTLQLRWTPVFLAGFTLCATALVWGLRRTLSAGRPETPPSRWGRPSKAVFLGTFAGLAFGATVITVRFMRMFVGPGNISQTFDNVFHLSAIRFILDSGNGSSLAIGSLSTSGPQQFYPAAWHDVVALVVQVSNVPIPVAVNVVNIVIGALVWTISGMYLATRVAGIRPAVLLMTGILAGSFGAFPYLLVDFGVLYPNFLGIALLPAFIALAADVLGLSMPPSPGVLKGGLLLALGAPGLALAHPNSLMALGAFVVPMLLYWLMRLLTGRGRCRTYWLHATFALLVVGLYLTLLVLAWKRFRPSRAGSTWPPNQSISAAVQDALTNSPAEIPLSSVLVVLTAIGFVAICTQLKRLWLLGPYLVGVTLFVVVSGFPAGPFRDALTGVFFNDSKRLAAMLPVIALPLTAVGGVWLLDRLASFLPRPLESSKLLRRTVSTAGILITLTIGIAGQNTSIGFIQDKTIRDYAVTPDSPLLSPDKAALLARADSKIPDGATVIVNPATGASLVYALANRNVILPTLTSPASPGVITLLGNLQELPTNPEVCNAVRKLNAFYVLDFGNKQIIDMGLPIPSSEALANTAGLTLLDQQGAAKLYRIDGCR
ncbi:DUF6541 family protein [Arthrobacter sp. GMC3]|uniref:DUF6541 family protein n=1 Tax=Arthrobacter sp. GMC3 TaxID=2058894 RepID=UPI000CE2B9C6|nr:DUF6541 family protein [Arthrobacter sp. GMC3]